MSNASKQFLTGLIILVLTALNSPLQALDIELIKTSLSDNSVPFVILSNGKRIALPFRSICLGIIYNKTKTIAAVNFHETSDYSGVDLVMEIGDDIYIIPRLDEKIEYKMTNSGTSSKWDQTYITALAIEGNRIRCHVVARTVDKHFIDKKIWFPLDLATVYGSFLSK